MGIPEKNTAFGLPPDEKSKEGGSKISQIEYAQGPEHRLDKIESVEHWSETVLPTEDGGKRNIFQRFYDSFKPMKIPDFDTSGLDEAEIKLKMMQTGGEIKPRHVVVSSMASCVGTGLFIGSGNSLLSGGPAGLILGFFVVGVGVICFMTALGELGTRYKANAFTTYVDRFMDQSLGFTVGWMYTLCWVIVMPLELIASAMVIQFWKTDDNGAARANPVAWVALFYAFIFLVCIVGVSMFAEVEFIIGSVKVIATIGFIIFSIVIVCGGGPKHKYIGAHYFYDPGAFAHGFKGVAAAIVNSSFAYGGTELSGLSAAESRNPHRAFPSCVKQVFWRVIIFFIIATLMVGLMLPYDNPRLSTSSQDETSPFVLAIQASAVSGLPSVFNTVILLSVLATANAAIFGASRMLVTLSVEHHAPKWLGYIDRRGRPTLAFAVCLTVGLLCFLAADKVYHQVFDWLYAFVSLSFLYIWCCICFCHIRHRIAMKRDGIPLSSLIYKNPFGVVGSLLGAIIFLVILAFQFWIGLFPIGGKPNAKVFFQSYLSVPFAIVVFIAHKLWKRTQYIRNKDVDVSAHLREFDWDVMNADIERHRKKMQSSILYRIKYYLC